MPHRNTEVRRVGPPIGHQTLRCKQSPTVFFPARFSNLKSTGVGATPKFSRVVPLNISVTCYHSPTSLGCYSHLRLGFLVPSLYHHSQSHSARAVLNSNEAIHFSNQTQMQKEKKFIHSSPSLAIVLPPYLQPRSYHYPCAEM